MYQFSFVFNTNCNLTHIKYDIVKNISISNQARTFIEV